MKYYAVLAGEEENIFTSWEECQAFLKNKKSYKMKSFQTLEEAKAFFDNQGVKPTFDEPTAFIDGSFDAQTNGYSFGGILIMNHQEYYFKKSYPEDQYATARNVAGEIKGAGYLINFAVKKGIKRLHLYYDYIGIEKWYLGQWKANSEIAIQYVNFANRVKDKIEIIFHKVKSHTNNYYNDLADKLAKEALGL